MRKQGKKFVDNTISYTTSSMAYKDPYRPQGWLGYNMFNGMKSFVSYRNIENEFVDYETFQATYQYRQIYYDLFNAYKRNDKVILSRSLSSSMFKYTFDRMKEGSPNPFFKDVKAISMVQARIYANQDTLIPEDQWAQITLKMEIEGNKGQKEEQYNVFERRLADKLSYFDWKLCYQGSREEFIYLHQKTKNLA